MHIQDLPYLDLTAADFSTRGTEVLAARTRYWCARTPFGIAVLRHRQAGQLLRDRRLRQGSHAWPKYMGLEGSFSEFWTNSVIGQEGDTLFWGRSFVANPYGEVIAEASESDEEILLATCDLEQLEEFRRTWPFFRDRRIDSFGPLTERWLDQA